MKLPPKIKDLLDDAREAIGVAERKASELEGQAQAAELEGDRPGALRLWRSASFHRGVASAAGDVMERLYAIEFGRTVTGKRFVRRGR